jgi:Subtilisin inhibitor-like
MMRRGLVCVALAASAATLAAVPAGAAARRAAAWDEARPAAAAPDEARPDRRHPVTRLVLSYRATAGYADAVVLWCDPARGPHPKAARVCATLAAAGGDPDRIRPTRTMCLLIYAPVTADVHGTWRGRPLAWSRTFANSCEMTRATGPLFRF